MSPRRQVELIAGLQIDPYSQIPARAQIKDGIKLAYLHQDLRPGQVLPSIRALALHLRLGDGVVRRAYRELCEAGVVAAKRRKHVVVSSALDADSEITSVVRACDLQSRLVTAWAREKHISAIAFGRFLLIKALAEEVRSPSYVFVDLCKWTAERCADKIAKAWEVRVLGVTVSEFADLQKDAARHIAAVLVNEHLYEDVVAIAGNAQRMLRVEIRLDERLWQRTRSIPARSSVLCVFSDEQFPRAGIAILQHFERLFRGKWRCEAKAISDIPDVAALIRTGRYRLSLFSPLVWDTLPARVKRMPAVTQMVWEPNPHALEAARISAGVLL